MTATIAPETLDREGGELVVRVQTIAVTDDGTFTSAGDMLKTVKAYLGRVAEVFDPMAKAAHEAHKAILEQRRKVEAHALEAERLLKTQMAGYQREQERKRREAEEARRLEQDRLEREEHERAEAERKRLQAEAEEERLRLALEAEQRGDTEVAARLVEAPVLVTAPPPRAVFAQPAVVTATPKVEGVSFREEWDFEIVDPRAIPREYMLPDEQKIRRVVRAMKAQANIPGIRAVPSTKVAARGGR